MMSLKKLQLSGAVSLAAMLVASSASAQSVSAEQIEKLQSQIQALQRELQTMKRKVDTPPGVVKAPPPPPTAEVRMSPGIRPSICTPDGLNCIAFTSRLHFDVGGYDYSPNSASTVPQHLDSGWNARRARIGVLGTSWAIGPTR
jgi:phosphate-selective porin OprO/OprP